MINNSNTTDGFNRKAYRPEARNMIVSISRHKNSLEDLTFTYQFPLSTIRSLDKDLFVQTSTFPSWAVARLRSLVEIGLHTSLTDMSMVWRLSESDQIATISDAETLCAAILDHQNAGKSMIQLNLVKNSDITRLPKHLV
ncbi:hypothetical protein KCU67_g6889, partial [Aureobasidium melanogenum]